MLLFVSVIPTPISHRIERPRGPAPVTKNPLSLLAYMRKMRKGAASVVGRRFERYGDIYYAPFLGRDVYVLRHPEHIREVLVRQASKMAKPTEGLSAKQLELLLGEGLLNANGESWRRRRRLIQPAFHPEKLRTYSETVSRYAEEAIAEWRDRTTIDVSREMMELTLRIVCSALFDHDVRTGGQTDRVADAVGTLRDSFGGIESVLPPWLPTPGQRRIQHALAEVNSIVYGLIDRRMESAERGDDLLGALIEATKGEDGLTRRELRDELLTLFVAGHETTSHALSWTLHLLGQNPDAAARAVEEIDALGSAPDHDALARLPWTRQCIEEAMRIYPPAYAVPRMATEDVEVGGWLIPKGADVVIWILHTHRDPRWFPDPMRFDPSRFDPEARKQIPQCAYLPFGAGQRTCIGKQFALMEAHLILAHVLRVTTLAPDPNHRVRAQLTVTMAPKDGLPMRVARR